MYLFYTFEQIKAFSCFSMIDFSTFSYFQEVIFTLGVNIYFVVMFGFILSVAYKLFNRIFNWIF